MIAGEKQPIAMRTTGILLLDLSRVANPIRFGRGTSDQSWLSSARNEVESMLHVMLDLYGCNPELLADEAFLRNVLEEYPNRIDMIKVGPAELRYIKTSSPLDDGYSGFVIIATSHVSLHAWAPYKMINIDVFSCEDFSIKDVVAFACETFQTKDVEVHAVERATRSPRLSPRVPQTVRQTDDLPFLEDALREEQLQIS